MTITTWSFYDKATGIFDGAWITGPLAVAQACPEQLQPVLGMYRPNEHVFDLVLGVVVPCATESAPVVGPLEVMAAIRATEVESLRALRELVLSMAQGQEVSAQALARLLQADQESAERRSQLPPQ